MLSRKEVLVEDESGCLSLFDGERSMKVDVLRLKVTTHHARLG